MKDKEIIDFANDLLWVGVPSEEVAKYLIKTFKISEIKATSIVATAQEKGE